MARASPIGNLLTIVGVDEAGYGPRLGPLVVGLSAFRAPAGADSLRDLLPVAAPGGPVPVDDSKRLYHGRRGLGTLERSVRAFLRAAADREVPDPPRETPPWLTGFPPAPPAAAAGDDTGEAARLVAAALRKTGVEVLAVRTRTVGVEEFNAGVERLGNKAEVLFEAVAGLLAPFLEAGGETEIHVDRHGGRAFYSRLLTAHFPGRPHLATRETASVSSYAFPRPGGAASLSFTVGADGIYLETALASMAAKWVRELHMAALNAFFGAAAPGLTPTAGYAADAGRWLRETRDLRRKLGVPDAKLVRVR